MLRQMTIYGVKITSWNQRGLDRNWGGGNQRVGAGAAGVPRPALRGLTVECFGNNMARLKPSASMARGRTWVRGRGPAFVHEIFELF